MQQEWKQRAAKAADGIRLRVLRHTIDHKGGYLSQACSAAELYAALYTRILKLAPLDAPLMPGRFTGTPGPGHKAVTGAGYNGAGRPECDNFVLSPAQYALVLYAVLVEAGRMAPEGMAQFNADGGVVEMIGAEHSPGMEVTTGSLGQGISQAAGMAFARGRRGDTGRVVLMLSDGECQSGQFWEAVQAMSYHKLDNMLAYVDVNGYQCDGKMDTVMSLEPFAERLRAFGAHVSEIDGHDLDALAGAADTPASGAPTFVLCRTDPSRGMKAILDSRAPKFHYIRFPDPAELARFEEYYQTMKKAGDA